MEGNEQADKAAKQAAARSVEEGVISLAHVRRRITEKHSAQGEKWLEEKLGKRSREAQKAYRPANGIKQNPAAAAAFRKMASWYYQMKMRHAAVGEFLQRRNVQISAKCCWCQASRESVWHLLFECQEWQRQQQTIKGDLTRVKIQFPTAAEEMPEARIFENWRATKALLVFTATMKAGAWGEQRREIERVQRDRDWGLEMLEEREREGEG